VKVFQAICLEDHELVDGDKKLELKRGKEYTVSSEKDGKVVVFSSYWASVDASWFGGAKPL